MSYSNTYTIPLKVPDERTPFRAESRRSGSEDESDDDEDFDDGNEAFESMKPSQLKEMRKADRLSMRLLAIPDEDEEEHDRILRRSLKILDLQPPVAEPIKPTITPASRRLMVMVGLAISGFALLGATFYVGVIIVGPPNQPVGPYRLIERQEGEQFFDYYTFYEGRDSVGSNGYNMYVSKEKAQALGIMNVSYEKDELDVFSQEPRRTTESKAESFVYMGTAPTPLGPRESIRLEGNRRFNRGLFVIDVRHMPAGCGQWPAFWLTDEANWPVNGEIDIIEGVNYQSTAKTALHSTKGCVMDDIPLGVMTGEWDTAQGVPDAKTGIPDMTLRDAIDCFVYNPQQWINQGCVAMAKENNTIGGPVNENGGGVYALEWDPINGHIRSWVFMPHVNVPENLRDAIRTAAMPEDAQVMPDPDLWSIPYAYYAIGEGTNCPASHFRHMRLVLNTAFCGSVSGNRFHLDCKKQAEQFDTCNDWIKSEPEEMNEAYWKVRGVYVYERQWERTWLN